ncbi:hypothetical protein DFH27DRAFT_641050 [Peziza echinospora]|nr:hypothetical protein DFH27DRAFT_641050 [Peziza echinospora]
MEGQDVGRQPIAIGGGTGDGIGEGDASPATAVDRHQYDKPETSLKPEAVSPEVSERSTKEEVDEIVQLQSPRIPQSGHHDVRARKDTKSNPAIRENRESAAEVGNSTQHAYIINQPAAAHLRGSSSKNFDAGLAPTLTDSHRSQSSLSSNHYESHDSSYTDVIELQEIRGGSGTDSQPTALAKLASRTSQNGRGNHRFDHDDELDEDYVENLTILTTILSRRSNLNLDLSGEQGGRLWGWHRLRRFWKEHIRVTVPWKYARDHLALERTFLSYHRTSLALGIASTVVIQLHTLNAKDFPPGETDKYFYDIQVVGKPLSVTLAAMALVFAVLGWVRWLRFQGAMLRGKCLVGGWEFLATAFGLVLGLYLERMVVNP